MPKTRLTGFARLVIFLLIALPIVFFAASYYNGEDPVATVKGWLGQDTQNEQPYLPADRPAENDGVAPATFENVQALRDENARLKRELAIRTEELARCRTNDVE